jgi:hypothetical protein
MIKSDSGSPIPNEPPVINAIAKSNGVADHWGRIVGKHARHRRQVADVAIDHAKQRDDGGLVGGDAVEITHGGSRTLNLDLAVAQPFAQQQSNY